MLGPNASVAAPHTLLAPRAKTKQNKHPIWLPSPSLISQAWMRVTRGTPPADPYTPGEGFVVAVEAARFLPANVTCTKVAACAFSADKQQLTQQFEVR